ncbi:MAG TPA: hypothetical protein H9769_11295 [Candidatus Microbacterium pullistercoris]|nr:hypothetical protein [Candidatus Microbacterium pullistercoris]
MGTDEIRVQPSWSPAVAGMAIGAALVILGGLVAAVASPLQLPSGSWLAAYLVLVCGVPQYAAGRLMARAGAVRIGWMMLACWNVANAAVIGGTLTRIPLVVDAGGILLLVPLIVAVRALLRRDGSVLRGSAWRGVLVALIAVLIVSMPIGLVLAHLRAG